ncbi:MAG TPA: PEP-CTERM sorting domain-containing protein, partial [Candidatus Angelobacter sp.]|nr:PEP-CTERM sorting domain-containing protein [Candidatus Angelobacter sp.]
MRFLSTPRTALCVLAVVVLATSGLMANTLAYASLGNADFGTVDLSTGAFTSLGFTSGALVGMTEANGTLYGSSWTGVLYTINPANGSETVVGSNSVSLDDFGATTTGMYAVAFGQNYYGDLYSINRTTGAATLIGPTGVWLGGWSGLSNNSSALYFAAGTNLYTLNVSTGAATLVGSLGSQAQEQSVLLMDGGTLYGSQIGPVAIDTIDPATGAATVGPTVVPSANGAIFGLVPYPLPSNATPEPGTLVMFGSGLLGLVGIARR